MKRLILLATFAAPLALAARAGAAPSFCAAAGDARLDHGGSLKDVLADEDPRNGLPNLVGHMCAPDSEDEDAMDDLEATRRRWSARLGLSEADWSDVVAYALLGQGERMGGDPTLANDSDEARKRAWTSFDPIDQYVWITRPMGASGALSLDPHYLVDAFGARLSETGRFAYIRQCIKTDNPVTWAMCQGDIERLDLPKLVSELRANKVYGGGDKIRIRVAVDSLRKELDAHTARVKALVAKDPGYAQMFALAAATRKQWDAGAPVDASLLELATQMDDARATRSRRAFEGCQDKTWAAWKSAVATLPAKAYEGVRDDRKNGKRFLDDAMTPIISNPATYLAAIALATCYTAGQEPGAPRDALLRFLGAALEYWPGFRGPRTATESAILGAGIQLDDRDAHLDFPRSSRPFGGQDTSTGGGGEGVVAALKPAGKTTTVEFKKQMVKQVQCAESRETRKIVQIRADGTLVYEVICVRNETVTVDKSDRPQTVNPRYLDGVKPGMYVSITEDVVVAAWDKPGAATPKMVFGVALR